MGTTLSWNCCWRSYTRKRKLRVAGRGRVEATSDGEEVCGDTDETLQLKGADDLQRLESLQISKPSVLQTNVAPPAGSCASASLQTAADQTVSSQLTEADVFTALRHMQIFQHQAAPQQQVTGPSALQAAVTRDLPAPAATTTFAPQPPSSSRPSHSQQPPSRWVGSSSSASSGGSLRNSSLSHQPHPPAARRRTRSAAAPDAEAEEKAQRQKVQGLTISRLFRQHALDQGLRVPKCVAKADPP
mmetsp:Transcript_31993/g.59476  ORF Transcript_31993/g.59476 Transcript_31993/m.59476 type:complete len:244 (-) Transcript_31993:305-1036(-)